VPTNFGGHGRMFSPLKQSTIPLQEITSYYALNFFLPLPSDILTVTAAKSVKPIYIRLCFVAWQTFS
jgi:hypothetical protein